MSTQGRQANRNGAVLEKVIETILRERNLEFTTQYRTGYLGLLDELIVVDFHVKRAPDFEEGLYIECRWQGGCGSVDKKIVALEKGVKELYALPTIVVVDGASAEKQRAYLLRNLGGRLRAAMTIAEFIAFSETLCEGGARKTIHRSFNPDQKRFC